jgi:hypothetical protein
MTADPMPPETRMRGSPYLTDWVGWGVLAGLGVTAWLLAGIGPLLVGAITGRTFSPRAGGNLRV